MKVSQQLIDFCKRFEQFRADAYMPTPNDRPTVGYGATYNQDGSPIEMGDTISEADASQLLEMRLDHIFQQLQDAVNFEESQAAQQQLDAVTSLCDNIGLSQFMNSTSGKMFCNRESIAERFEMWNRQAGIVLRGLTKRRLAEKAIYENGDYGQ